MNLEQKITDIVSGNTREVPFEGKEVDVEGIVDQTKTLLDGLMMGFGTYVLRNYTIKTAGWQNNETGDIKSRSQVIDEFLNKI